MKRFLKHDRYEMKDWERENTWQGIRQELNPRSKSPLFRLVPLRPALTVAATMAALVVLGVWWIDTNQPDKIQSTHPGLLADGPTDVTRQTVAPTEKPILRAKLGKEAGTESLTEAEVKKTPRGALDEDQIDAPETFEIAVSPPAEETTKPEPKKTPRGALHDDRNKPAETMEMASADLAIEKSHARAAAPAGVSLTGRVLDPETGEGLAYANVLIRVVLRPTPAGSSTWTICRRARTSPWSS